MCGAGEIRKNEDVSLVKNEEIFEAKKSLYCTDGVADDGSTRMSPVIMDRLVLIFIVFVFVLVART